MTVINVQLRNYNDDVISIVELDTQNIGTAGCLNYRDKYYSFSRMSRVENNTAIFVETGAPYIIEEK